ncbi:MAG TPA: D-aminoacyl-tRNA deacylase [Ktedonobacteraceae bacterium]|jgi:D-tyrosyl-tRNA(Tyr) deacylase|nr:D-aminoacyl-tRNA deacylase [Ktedonobacteraceae bacterium]
MRALLQRVSRASVTVENEIVGEIGPGLLILLGVGHGDSEAQAKTLAEKIVYLRIFEDEASKMNRSLLDIGGEALVVSQFTLYADVRKGRRPSFTDAAPPSLAQPLVERFQEAIAAHGLKVAGGVFGASMQVELVNSGPVTIWLDSEQL